MNKNYVFILLIISLFTFSCDTDDDNIEQEQHTPWNNRLYNGINQINGIDIFDLPLDSSTSINLDDYCCIADLPQGSFTSIRLKIWIPSHPNTNYQAGIETFENNRITIRYGGGQYTEDIYLSGSGMFLGHSEDPYDSNKILSGFSVDGIISSNYNINRDNFEFVEFPFYLVYRDDNGNEIHRSERSYSLLNSFCN